MSGHSILYLGRGEFAAEYLHELETLPCCTMLSRSNALELPEDLSYTDLVLLETGPLIAVLVLGGLGTGIARVVQATMAGRVGAPRASIIGYLVPIVAVVLGVVFRNETLDLLEAIGFAAVLVSAYLVTRAVRRA